MALIKGVGSVDLKAKSGAGKAAAKPAFPLKAGAKKVPPFGKVKGLAAKKP